MKKFDLRLSGYFIREVEGKDIESALINAGILCDVIEPVFNTGYLGLDMADIIRMANVGNFSDELTAFILSPEFTGQRIDFGLAD